MWFIKLSFARWATKACELYTPRPPPLPDPPLRGALSRASQRVGCYVLRLIALLSIVPSVSAAPPGFWTVCYVNWVGGIASGGLLYVLLFLVLSFWPEFRCCCWVAAPLASNSVKGVLEVFLRIWCVFVGSPPPPTRRSFTRQIP